MGQTEGECGRESRLSQITAQNHINPPSITKNKPSEGGVSLSFINYNSLKTPLNRVNIVRRVQMSVCGSILEREIS